MVGAQKKHMVHSEENRHVGVLREGISEDVLLYLSLCIFNSNFLVDEIDAPHYVE